MLVLIVAKIGNYKYATANRHFGFELYLDNKNLTVQIQDLKKYEIGWEQALRSWRVVQASIFDKIYYTTTNTKFWNIYKRFKFNHIKRELKTNKPEVGWWFEPTEMVGGDPSKWYPGRYLKSMQFALLLFAYLSLIPLFMMPMQFQYGEYSLNYNLNTSYLWGIKYITLFSGLVAFIAVITLLFKARSINARRKILESGLLSIHSCAIMWEVVILAHKRALKKSKDNQSLYLKYLSDEANDIIEYAHDIYEWIVKVKNQSSNAV